MYMYMHMYYTVQIMTLLNLWTISLIPIVAILYKTIPELSHNNNGVSSKNT